MDKTVEPVALELARELVARRQTEYHQAQRRLLEAQLRLEMVVRVAELGTIPDSATQH